jgi:hypothetical protein
MIGALESIVLSLDADFGFTCKFSSVSALRTGPVEVYITVKVSIATAVDVHVGVQFALEPRV